MKNIKFAVLACGVLGLIGFFLPMVSAEGMSFSFWDAHKAPDGVQVYLVMAGYALAAVMGAMGAAKGMKRPQGIAAAVGFGFVIFKFRGGFMDLIKAAIGAKLMFVAALVGVVVAVIAAAKPEETA
ncbi:MAG: hypothetical protein JF590_08160 [Gemmatimonadetes bacterium]|nr:hypothetical protein [Gemmatimonadota bacterium]